ncbi:MAG: PorT family protein [Tannerella sp.]|jgi:hypothetical protein|nr:PorT family protein [Tannerella sp.]
MKRKKTALLAISLILAATQVVSAQFTTGLKAGLNISDVHFDIPLLNDEIEFRRGLNIGVFGRYFLNDRLDVQAELLYSQQGYRTTTPVTDVGGNILLGGYKSLAHYLNIPVLIKFYPVRRIYLEAGPQAEFCLGHAYSASGKEMEDALSDAGFEKNTADLSLTGGIGLCLGKGFSVNARYCHGLLKMPSGNTKYNNRVIQFSLACDLWSF